MSMVSYYGEILDMNEKTATKKPARKRNRPKQTYKHHTNAVCVTVYHPMGETIPAAVRKEIEESVMNVALSNQLLINIALT